jgi:hypothetical protein
LVIRIVYELALWKQAYELIRLVVWRHVAFFVLASGEFGAFE